MKSAKEADAARNAAVEKVGGYIDQDECWEIADKVVELRSAEGKQTSRDFRRKVFSSCAEGLTFANRDADTVASTRKIIECKISATSTDEFKGCK